MHINLDCKVQAQICSNCGFHTKPTHSHRTQVVLDTDFAGIKGTLHIGEGK